MQEKIEILPVTLLDEHRALVSSLKRLATGLGLSFGWHYLLDLTWIISHLGAGRGKRVMDAGAGTGILQWYLAQQGAEVLSVDRTSRAALPVRLRKRFRVEGLRQGDLLPGSQVFWNLSRTQGIAWRARLGSQVREIIGTADLRRSPGKVIIYNQDLKTLVDIPDNALDAIVAVSALEHNDPGGLLEVVAEMERVLKPGGVLLATLGAAKDRDWFHEPSRGWCYTDASLRRLFGLPSDTPSNYEFHDELFEALVGCAELRDHLADFYYRSGDNGMPWGKWDPQYQPVGVLKVKA